MNRLCHIRLSRDQTLLFFALNIAVIGIPRRTDSGILLGIPTVYPENQISAFHQFLPAVSQRRVFLRFLRLPGIKKG